MEDNTIGIPLSIAENRMVDAFLEAHRLNLANVVPDFTPDLASVYRMQSAVSAQLGPVTGYKVAADSEGRCLIAPLHHCWLTGGTIDAHRSRQRGVELEIGFILKADPPASTEPQFEQRLKDCAVPCSALEIVETRLADSDAAGPMWRLADNQRNAGWIGAKPIMDWSSTDLRKPCANLRIGERCVWDGATRVPGGDAFRNFAAGIREVHRQGKDLHAGHIILTGSLTGLAWARAGDRIQGWVQGLGPVSAKFAPCKN